MLSVSQHKMYKSAHATELWTSIWVHFRLSFG